MWGPGATGVWPPLTPHTHDRTCNGRIRVVDVAATARGTPRTTSRAAAGAHEAAQPRTSGPGPRCSYGSTWLRQAPLLVRSAAAGPDLELYSIGGDAGGVVQAFAGGRIDQLSVDRLPLLVRTAVAGPPFDEGAVGGVVSGDIQAATVDGDG